MESVPGGLHHHPFPNRVAHIIPAYWHRQSEHSSFSLITSLLEKPTRSRSASTSPALSLSVNKQRRGSRVSSSEHPRSRLIVVGDGVDDERRCNCSPNPRTSLNSTYTSCREMDGPRRTHGAHAHPPAARSSVRFHSLAHTLSLPFRTPTSPPATLSARSLFSQWSTDRRSEPSMSGVRDGIGPSSLSPPACQVVCRLSFPFAHTF